MIATQPVGRRPWPRLTEDLPYARHPEVCQACGMQRELGDDEAPRAWQEHDERDTPEARAVMLCRPCADKLIVPHKRLYRQLDRNEPLPGTMLLCLSCLYRDGVGCTHPDLKANGGPGLRLTIPQPTQAFACIRGRGKGHGCHVMKIWPGRATACAGRKVEEAQSRG